MDRELRKAGIDPGEINPLDRLAWLGTHTMGALIYQPDRNQNDAPLIVDIANLGENAVQLYEGKTDKILPALFRAGGSPGGARPKVLVATKADQIITAEGDIPPGYTPWIVKFNTKEDFPDAGNIEYAYSLMAKDAGIDMPHTTLMAEKYFAVHRFDRIEGRRQHMHTLGNMIGADFRIPNLDYIELMKVVLDVTKNQQQLLKAFRQMVFNIVTHNRDDHSKNFSFIWNENAQGWQLSPAYDLMFSTGINGEHTMTIAGEGKFPEREHVMKVAKAITMGEKARQIVDEVNEIVSNWSRYMDMASVSDKSKQILRNHISML